MYRRIVVGLDGSEGSRRALATAMSLARAARAELFLVSIEELPRFPAAIDEIDDEQAAAAQYFGEVQRAAMAEVGAAGLGARYEIRTGHPAQALPSYAGEVGADLLVIGCSGNSGIWGHLLGTTADKVVDHAPCSVLVVRAPAPALP
jgi:nucleotide-binding universal stress UspA family protein